jgi:hypothetical protein
MKVTFPDMNAAISRAVRKSLTLLWTAAAVLLSCAALAQENIPPPKAPFVAPAPDPGDWKLVIKNPAVPATDPGAAPKPDFRIVEVHSTVGNKLKRDIITYGTGKTDERWFLADFLLWKGTGGDVVAHDMRDSGPGSVGGGFPSVASGFPGLEWLSASNFDKVVMVEKRPCYHFANGDMEAWIDVKTKLPVSAKYRDLVYQYTFNTAPTTPLVMPAEYQATWDLYQARIRKAEEFQKSLRNNQ